MKILSRNDAEAWLKLSPDSTEDLWHLERVLEKGDFVASKTLRRFKTAEGESADKKPVFIQVEAEKIEFSKHANRVRVTGKIVGGGPEDLIQLGSYHTIDIDVGTRVEVKKPGGWKKHQLDRLKKAVKATRKPKLGVVVMDDSLATFARIMDYGVDFPFTVRCTASKRGEGYEEARKQYLGNVAKGLSDLKVSKLVVAGPGFAKDSLKKFLGEHDPGLLEGVRFDSCSSSEQSGVYELLKRGALAKAIGEAQLEKEFELVERLLAEIGRDTGLAAYGLAEVKKAVEYGAVDQLFVLDELLRTDKQVEKLLEQAEKLRCEAHVFSAENDAGKQLEGLGGLAALLRFKVS